MKRIEKLKVKVFLLSLMLILSFIFPVYAQTKIRVGILPVLNKTGLSYFDSLTSAVEENVLFIANQLNRYTIIDGRYSRLNDPTQIRQLKKIAGSMRCNFLISGEVTSQQGAYILTLVLYDAQTETVKSIKNAPFSRLIEVFNVSDKLSISLLEELTGEHIRRGTIYFVNKTPGTAFSVMVNKRQLEDNVSTVTLIEGTYSIKIFNKSGGKRRVLSETIEVIEGDPIYVEFDLSRKVTASFETKNTIRTTLPGVMILSTQNTNNESNLELQTLAFIFPTVSYSRMFTKNIGLNIGLGVLSSPNILNQRDSIGIEIKAGPNFRFGRISLIPMIGYSFLFISPAFDQYSLNDFREKTLPGEYGDEASLSHSFLILLGFEFFFTPNFSIYAESGFAVGNYEEIQNRSGVQYMSELSTGFELSLGIGISF